MSKKKQVYLLALGTLVLVVSLFFTPGSKFVLSLTLLASCLFVWASLLLLRHKLPLMRCLSLFLLIILLFNGLSGMLLHQNRLLLNTPQCRYYSPQNPFTRSAYDGIYYSVTAFTQLGCQELMPSNQTSRAIALLLSLTGYLGLGVLVVLLHRAAREEQ